MDDYDDEEYGLEQEDDELFDDYDSTNEDNLDDDFDDDLDDEEHSDDDHHDVSYYEALGVDDGRFDREHHMLPHSGFGSSVDLDELDENQREAYELGYGIGAEDYDLKSDK